MKILIQKRKINNNKVSNDDKENNKNKQCEFIFLFNVKPKKFLIRIFENQNSIF